MVQTVLRMGKHEGKFSFSRSTADEKDKLPCNYCLEYENMKGKLVFSWSTADEKDKLRSNSSP